MKNESTQWVTQWVFIEESNKSLRLLNRTRHSHPFFKSHMRTAATCCCCVNLSFEGYLIFWQRKVAVTEYSETSIALLSFWLSLSFCFLKDQQCQDKLLLVNSFHFQAIFLNLTRKYCTDLLCLHRAVHTFYWLRCAWPLSFNLSLMNPSTLSKCNTQSLRAPLSTGLTYTCWDHILL